MSARVIPAPGTSGTVRASERVMSRVELTTSARLCVPGSARGLGGSNSKGFRIRSRWRVCKRCKRGLAVLLTISAARSFGSVGSGGEAEQSPPPLKACWRLGGRRWRWREAAHVDEGLSIAVGGGLAEERILVLVIGEEDHGRAAHGACVMAQI